MAIVRSAPGSATLSSPFTIHRSPFAIHHSPLSESSPSSPSS